MTPQTMAGGVALGFLLGAISGVVGVGGALLIPALVWLFGMSQLRAQGTSIATLLLLIGTLAFWKYYQTGNVDLRLALVPPVDSSSAAALVAAGRSTCCKQRHVACSPSSFSSTSPAFSGQGSRA